jgi:hypothetical protein
MAKKPPYAEHHHMANRWLQDLLRLVGSHWEWQGLALRIGYQYRKPEDKDDCWEVWVHPAVQEIAGGKHDGDTGWSGFHLDVSGLLEEIEVEAVSVTTRMTEEPPELVIEGKFRGRDVLLHVYLEPPEGTEASEVIDLTGPGGASIRDKD